MPPDPNAAQDTIWNTLLLTAGAALLTFLGKLGDLFLKYKARKWKLNGAGEDEEKPSKKKKEDTEE